MPPVTFPNTAARQRRDNLTAVIANTKTAVTQVNQLARDALAKAGAAYRDRDLTPEAQARHAQDAQSAARKDIGASVDQIRARLATAVRDITADADAARPSIDWASAAAVQRAQVKWDQVRMRLEAGMPLRTILAGADLDTAVAIREWAPAWLDATRYRGTHDASTSYTPDDHAAFLRTVDRRLAELAGGHVALVMQDAADARAVAAWAGEHLKHLEALAAGRPADAIGAAVAAELAEAQARAEWPTAELEDQGATA